MSSTWTNPLASFFFAGQDSKNTPQALRQKIALAMMMQKRAAPRNFGEGLSAIGDAIGDRSMTRQIEGEAAEAERAATAARSEILGAPPPTSMPPPPPPAATALDAVNRAAQPPTPIVPARPPVAAQPPMTAPSGGAAPVAAGPGGLVEPGDFNEIDAADPRNRYKPPPPYLAAALERNIADPERRAYLGQLAGKEAQSATEVSPTGAAGPFQFTRGTGAQYGIPGAARLDPDASTVAANRFTDDNVKALTARLGREPTPGEMALAHQQGAGTAGGMLQGTGNASPRNLAVNNVPPGMGPQAAAQRVMSYYGMPGATGAPPSPRDGVTAALTAQQEPPPPAPGRPTVADYGQKLALAPTPPAQEIAQAPPAAPPIQRAPPPPQVAQAQLAPGIGPEPTPPPITTPRMQQIQNMINNTPPAHRDTVREQLAPIYAQEEAQVKLAHEAHKEKLAAWRQKDVEQYKRTADAPKTQAEIDKIRHDIAAGKIIQSEGRIFRVEGDGVKDITPGQTGDGPPQIKMTQDQSDTLKFYRMGLTGASQLEGKERILAEGWKDELAGKVPFAGNKLLSSQYRAAKNAAGLLVQADLRDTSGATIGTQEFKDRFDLLVPRPGDDEMAMRNKAEARRAVLEGQRLALGTARPMADYVDKEHAKGRAEKMSTLNREMEGKDKGKTYEKNGVFRKWNGTAWEEY